MIKDSELFEVLSNGEARARDQAAISRMQARLEVSLGAAFDREVVRPSAAGAASSLRRLGWLGGGAIAVVSAVWLAGPSAAPEVPLPAAKPAAPVSESPREEEPAVPVSAAPAPPPSPQQPAVRAPRSAQPAARRQQGGNGLAANGDKARVRPTSTVPAAGLAEELSGLDEIRALMISSPQRALAAAAQQQQAFSRGALGPERALLRLDALLRLGRTSEAQQLAQQLLAAPADQPYRARIRKLLDRAK